MAGLSSCCFLYQAFKLFALAMTDEGPGMHQRESKLWNPCSKVQANINEEKLAALRRSFEEVNWDVELIRQLKKEVDGDLVVLEGQLAKMHSNMRIEDHNPLNYDCGYEYERHLDRCNENAQITTFLVVVCSVLVGVARWAGNLLIAMLHLILRMA
ncbi:hypothetical protein SERLADRAFT_404569 [Serpula lacrymans var. lacrymans S7.9]|uniref:Syntaxin 6 N-terminal domain-containing protein n=1 Tax=Serpula lacrymans var. lacrymans (strain S7.9) TaxID=578457 RepID=F8NE35_SERL9|nr:uncharacterized protein SERLADRAFT_404569 [Serpula lacrymans var. lacrymans S7.9]EGO30364.1 hypothetical protein SERLADRAFT_404569 [Serpula lacrymans var. lacrymans S7.9]